MSSNLNNYNTKVNSDYNYKNNNYILAHHKIIWITQWFLDIVDEYHFRKITKYLFCKKK